MTLDPQLLLRLYRMMSQVRAFELALEREFKRGNVPGMLHTGLGQEAVQAAIAANLHPTDCFFPDHRCHGLLFLAGTPGEKIMAELFGKAAGVCGGKGGSLHSADASVGNFGDNAIEGSMMVTALGAALGWKMQHTERVAAVIVGDGTSGRGEWHESMNLAATWQVPLLYACVNNGYAISTPVGYSHATTDLVDFARAYKIPAVQVDGNDIEAAHEATRAAIVHMRAGKGPYFVEYKTWRWQGIFSGEFRPAAEISYYRNEPDPIKMARAKILAEAVATEAALFELEADISTEIESWIAFAKASPAPDPRKATAHVYVGWGGCDAMKTVTFVQALNSALDMAMAENDRVFLMGEDIGRMGGDFGVTRGLWAKYGEERVRDTPLSEAGFVGAAVGAAMVGMRPVAEIMFADFMGECYDQMVNNAAKMHYMFDGQFKAPMVVRTASGGGFGGGPHHSQSVEGWFLNVPGLVIVAPSDPYDAKGLLLASIENDNPVFFLEHKALYRLKGEVPEERFIVPLRKARTFRAGTDVTVVATMRMVHEAMAAAEELAKDGISVEVIDLRTLRPWDTETVLDAVARTGRLVVANEAPKIGSLASDVAAVVAEEAFHHLKAPILRVCGLDTPIPFSVPLEKIVLPGRADVVAAVRKILA